MIVHITYIFSTIFCHIAHQQQILPSFDPFLLLLYLCVPVQLYASVSICVLAPTEARRKHWNLVS